MNTVFRIPTLLCYVLFASWAVAHSHHRGPISHISLVENPRISSPSNRIHAGSSFDITFTLNRGSLDVRLALEPNEDALAEDATIQYIGEDGKITSEPIHRHSVRVFKGTTYKKGPTGWENTGWARIFVEEDGVNPVFEGVFSIDHETHHVQTRNKFLTTKHAEDPDVEESGADFMVVFKDSDIAEGGLKIQGRGEDVTVGSSCGTDNLEYNMRADHPVRRSMDLGSNASLFSRATDNAYEIFGIAKRQILDSTQRGGNAGVMNLAGTIGSTTGCPVTRQVALIGVATDCTYAQDFPNRDAIRNNVIQQMNAASALFESTFRISLGLHSLIINDANCPGTAPQSAPYNLPCPSATIEDRLNIFSEWRGTQRGDGNALWTLLTKCNTGSAVGLAWLGMLCMQDSQRQGANQVLSGANVVARTTTEWKVIAHEIGHTFGAVHDCTSGLCANQQMVASSQCCPLDATTCDARQQFLMNPSTNSQVERFSPCTVGNVCTAILRRSVNASCLSNNRNVTVLTENRCGNGIVEPGEQCDCGGPQGCRGNTCCDPNTCRFINNAVCDDGNEECCQSCQFAPASTVCRASTGVCDPQETCTGRNATCPDDRVNPDGSSCGNGLQCASGTCTSRDQQCRTIMGMNGASNPNDIRSCDGGSCQLLCTSPQFGAGVCYSMRQNFLDGTRCNGDGVCRSGSCRNASTLGGVRSWIESNRTIVIAVSATVGGIIVIWILSCVFRCCCGKGRKRKNAKRISSPPQYVARADLRGRPDAFPQMQQQQPVYQPYRAQPPHSPPQYQRTASARYA